MSKNNLVTMLVLAGVVLLGLGGSYWAYKKIQAKRNQEYRYEGSLPIREGFDSAEFKETILSDDNLERVIRTNDLVVFWDVPNVESAQERIRKKFMLRVADQRVYVSYQDRDQVMSQAILSSLIDGMLGKGRSRQGRLPLSP